MSSVENIRGADIVFYSLFPWENSFSSIAVCLVKELGKHNRVFYINPPYTKKDYWSQRHDPLVQERSSKVTRGQVHYKRFHDMPENVICVQLPNVWPINFLPHGRAYAWAYSVNEQIVHEGIRQVIEDYKLKDFVFVNCFNPFYGGFLPKGSGQLIDIYQCVDDMGEEVYSAKHGAKMEEQLIKTADMVMATSANIKQTKAHLQTNGIQLLHNAADFDLFHQAVTNPTPLPKELASAKGRIIGYTGNLNEYRIDYPLLVAVAKAFPEDTLLLVGPLNSDDYKIHGLDALPNVIFTGGKHISELPGYLRYMTVTIIPFLCNKMTASIYPLKINEYLAAGKPVIATDFSIDIRTFEDIIYLAENHTSFISGIAKALSEDTLELQERRIERASKNTWEHRVHTFWEHIENGMAK